MTNITKYAVQLCAGVAASLLLAGAAHAQGISGTKHNLTATGAGDNDEICVYCHTPHASNTTVTAPLWNKPTADPAAFTTYDANLSATLDGTTLPVGSVSIACLSCHDGTQAVDTVINQPGSGAFGPTGGEMDGTTPGTPTIVGVANLAQDLRNDHPIGIQYGGFTVAGATAQIDPDFVAPQTATINTVPQWWVDTGVGVAAQREKTDMILYTRDNGGASQPFVECASCHDPHNATNPTFLRISNASSGVCLACHNK